MPPHLDDLTRDRVVYDRLTPTLRALAYAATYLWAGLNPGHDITDSVGKA